MTNCCHLSGTILRRWKKNWFDLWSDGRLVFYDDQQRWDMEDDIHMKVDCINIRSSSACRGGCDLSFLLLLNRRTRESLKSAFLCSTWEVFVQHKIESSDVLFYILHYLFPDLTPPEGKGKDCLLQIVCRNGWVVSLCADSADDALWVPVSQYYFTLCVCFKMKFLNINSMYFLAGLGPWPSRMPDSTLWVIYTHWVTHTRLMFQILEALQRHLLSCIGVFCRLRRPLRSVLQRTP